MKRYSITVNGVTTTQTGTSLFIKTLLADATSPLEFTVIALPDEYDTSVLQSAPATYTVNMTTPTVELINIYWLKITPLSLATGYNIYVDGELWLNTTDVVVDLGEIDIPYGSKCTVTVRGINEYGLSNESVSITYTNHEIEDSWDEIISSVNDGTYATKYSVGDYKPLDLGSEGVVRMQIAAFNTDVLSNSEGNAHITWVAADLLATKHNMNNASTIDGGWEASQMRTYLSQSVWALIPANVQNAIIAVDKTYYDRLDSSTETCSDKLCIPSWREMNLTQHTGKTRETSGVIYNELFTDANSRIRMFNGSSLNWWLRSSYITVANGFCYVSSSGSGDDINASYKIGVVIGFCM
jgi:hypothetical protein